MPRPAAHREQIDDIQRALREAGRVDGWLFYDFRVSDPLAYRVLKLDPTRHVTRRWYYWIPARGTPAKLMHAIEPHVLDDLPGEVVLYAGWEEQQAHLRRLLKGVTHVAMQYSPLNAVPYISRVDAGTVELIRGFGIEVVTSADLVQEFEAVWDDRQLASHKYAATKLRRIVDEAFGQVRKSIAARKMLTEYGLQQFILQRFKAHGLVTSMPPIAAVNVHTANPHYGPPAKGSRRIKKGDLVLIDIWAKKPAAGSVYADITWTGFVGTEIPARQHEVFVIVRDARDAALNFVRKHVSSGRFPCGWEVDEVCRNVIRHAGYGDRFVHRTGHSIGEEVHGNGANIDSLETKDARRLLPRTCFSIEPGIYLPGEFGIRSELDVYVSDRDAHVFGQPVQTAIVPILRKPQGARD